MEKKTPIEAFSNRRLICSVAVTLAIKVAVIVLLGFLFFSTADRITTNDQTVASALIGSAATQTKTETALRR